MANDLVVQLGAKLDQFQSDMNQAGDIADSAVSKIEQSFANLNPTAGGFGTLLTGAAAGVAGIIALVVALNKNLADMQTTATQVGLTLKEFQGVQFGGQVAGLSTDKINEGLAKSSQLLNDASRNSNSLSKALEANGLSVKNSNGQLLTENQLLQVAGDLVSRARNPQDAIAIAQMLGYSREWVPLLQQGATTMRDLGDEAQKAGAVIDDETIKRATEFDQQWRKSSVEWSTSMKAAIADMLPEIDNFIDRAVKMIDEIKRRVKSTGDVPGSVAEAAAGSALSYMGIDPNRGIAIDTSGLQEAVRDWKQQPVFSINTWENFGKALWDGFAVNVTPQQAESLVKWTNGTGNSVGDTSPAALRSGAFWQSQASDMSALSGQLSGLKFGSPTDVPSGDQADAVDRAINSLRRHAEQTEADTKAVGLGDAALARFRAEAAETAAVQANGGKETAEQAAKFKALQDRAEAAAAALAKARVEDDISRGQQTAFLTPQDLQIANQLKGIYPDVATALNRAEAASLRFNATIKDLANLGQDVNRGFLVDFETQIRNGASAMDALKTAGLNALGKIADKLAQMAADNLWSAAFGGSSGSSILSLFYSGATNANGSIAGAIGPTSVGGAPLVGANANGTDYWRGGLSLVGENGPELLNIPRGSQVIPNDVLKSGGMGGAMTVHAGSTVVIQGDASEKTVALIRAALQQHDATLPTKVVAAVKDAKSRRVLA